MIIPKKNPIVEHSIVKHPPQASDSIAGCIKWNIKSSLLKDPLTSNTPIMSESYKFGETLGKTSEWRIVLSPGYMEGKSRYLSIRINMTYLDPLSDYVDVYYGIQLMESSMSQNYNTNLHNKNSTIRRFTRESNTFGWDKYILYNSLGTNPPEYLSFQVSLWLLSKPDPDYFSSLLPNPTHLHPGQATMEELIDTDEIMKEEQLETLNLVSVALWSTKYGADLMISCDRKDFPVHSYILKDKSRIFQEYISTGQYSLRKSINMGFIDGEIMHAVLEHCYTQQITKILRTDQMFTLLITSFNLKTNELTKYAYHMLFCRVNVNTFKNIFEYLKKLKKILANLETDGDGVGNGSNFSEYSMSEFLCELSMERSKYPKDLMDYQKDFRSFAEMIFDMKPEPLEPDNYDLFYTY